MSPLEQSLRPSDPEGGRPNEQAVAWEEKALREICSYHIGIDGLSEDERPTLFYLL